MSDAPEKGVCDYAKRHRVVTHTSGNELQGPAITFGCYDSDRDARQALTDAGFTNGQWGWRNECGYSTAHITPVLEYTGYRRADLPPTLEAAMQLPEVLALVEAAEYIVDGMGIDGPEYKMDPNDEYADAANSTWVCDTLTRLCTAMSAFSEAKP